MGRKPTPPLEVAGKVYRCAHAAIWPPMEITVYQASAEELRYTVEDVVYQRLRTWEQVCGLREMDPAKCTRCPHVIVNGKPLRQPGTGVSRRIDTPGLMLDRQRKEKK